MASTFPTLTKKPTWPLIETYEDNVIRSPFEAGYEHTRKRFTRDRNIISVKYTYLPSTDKNVLVSFYNSVELDTEFSWTHPLTSSTYTMRFENPLMFEYVEPGYWNIDITLKSL